MRRPVHLLVFPVVLWLVMLAVGPTLAQSPAKEPRDPGQTGLSPAPVGFVVNTAADPGDGTCDLAECTLREAINATNALPGHNTIAFDIPGLGPHTIQPLTALPAITDSLTIDGYTQPGASWNSLLLEDGNNAVIMIELDGSLTGPTQGLLIGDGVEPVTCSVHGLAINRCFYGIRIMPIWSAPSATRHVHVQGCYVGLDPTGSVDLGNTYGIRVGGDMGCGAYVTIGGNDEQNYNVISGNDYGIRTEGSRYVCQCLIEGNLIGPSAAGVPGVGNTVAVYLEDGDGDTVGQNIIAYNGYASCRSGAPHGTVMIDNGANTQFWHNSIHSNDCELGIDWYPDGVTPNDSPDADNIQNYPVLTSAFRDPVAGEIVVQGTLHSHPLTGHYIHLYANAACDPSGYGEGEVWLGQHDVTTDALGDATFEERFADPGLPVLTSTATRSDGSTSEFSGCVEVVDDLEPPAITVASADAFGATLAVIDALSGMRAITVCNEGGATVTVGAFEVGMTDTIPVDVTYTDPEEVRVLIAAQDVAGNASARALLGGVQNHALAGGYSGVDWDPVKKRCIIHAWFRNSSDDPLLTPVTLRVAHMSGPGCSSGCTINGHPAVKGLELPLQVADMLAPGETVTYDLTVQMSAWAPFALYVDVLGVAVDQDVPAVPCDAWVAASSQPVSPMALDPGPPGSASYRIYLPLAPLTGGSWSEH